MKPAQINFVKECLPVAVSAGAAFNLNPLAILAQAAFESGWGTSNLAKESRNYFGPVSYTHLTVNQYEKLDAAAGRADVAGFHIRELGCPEEQFGDGYR